MQNLQEARKKAKNRYRICMIICDAHVHIYPCYDEARLVASATCNLKHLGHSKFTEVQMADADLAICLVERQNCHFFAERLSIIGHDKSGGFFVDRVWPGHCSTLIVPQVGDHNGRESSDANSHGQLVYVFAGRQVVTKEGLEVLCLLSDASISDGLEFEEIRLAIANAGGICVINWAPGKWWFERGKIVSRIIDTIGADEHSRHSVLLGDTTLRPWWWKVPEQMLLARKLGVGIVAGSDPLPFAGEENIAGTYGMFFDGKLDQENPVETMRTNLFDCSISSALLGKRDGMVRFLTRQVRLRLPVNSMKYTEPKN